MTVEKDQYHHRGAWRYTEVPQCSQDCILPVGQDFRTEWQGSKTKEACAEYSENDSRFKEWMEWLSMPELSLRERTEYGWIWGIRAPEPGALPTLYTTLKCQNFVLPVLEWWHILHRDFKHLGVLGSSCRLWYEKQIAWKTTKKSCISPTQAMISQVRQQGQLG